MSRRLQTIDAQIERTLQDLTSGVQQLRHDIRAQVAEDQSSEAMQSMVDTLSVARLGHELTRLCSVLESTLSKLTVELCDRDDQLVQSRRELRKAWEESSRQVQTLSFWGRILVVATFCYVFLLGSLLWIFWNQTDVRQHRVQQPATLERQASPSD